MTLSLSPSQAFPHAHTRWRSLVVCTAVLSTLTACGPAESSAPPAKSLSRGAVPFDARQQVSALGTPAQVSPEIPLNVAATAEWFNEGTVVTAGNGLYLAIWSEYSQVGYSPPDIVGVRIRASDGAVLDASPIHIASTQVDYAPAVAFDGTHFLVVWQDTSYIPTIRGARVRASDGVVLDASPPRYSANTNQFPYFNPAVAFDGTNYLVVWSGVFEHAGSIITGLQGRRIRPSDGLPIESAPFFIASDNIYPVPKVAYGDGHYWVTWTNGPVKGVRINTLGQVLDTSPRILTASAAGKVQVASQGGSLLVVWTDSNNALRATRIRAPDGARLGPPDILLDVAVDASTASSFSVTFDGVDYQVVWQAARNGVRTLLNTRVSAAGAVAPGSEVSLAEFHPSAPSDWVSVAAAGPGRFLASYSQYAAVSGNRRPQARRVEHVRAALSPLLPVGPLMAPGVVVQRTPAVAAGDGLYLVVWQENTPYDPSRNRILALRVDASAGTVLDSSPLVLSQIGGPGTLQFDPAVAFAGGNFLVVWTDMVSGNPFVIRGVRVRASDGAVLETPQRIGGFFPPAEDATPAVASDGTQFLVAWTGWVSDDGPPQKGIQLTRINAADGQRVAGSNRLLAVGGERPKVAYGDGRFFVAWQVSNQGYNAYWARIDAATGVPIDASPQGLATSVADENLVAVTSSGSQFFVALRVGAERVRALRINGATGLLLDSPSLIVAESSGSAPGVTFDGSDYRVAWAGPVSGAREFYSTRVSPQGQLGVGEEYGFSSGAALTWTDAPAIAAAGPGRFLVAWAQSDLGSNSVRIRLVNETAPVP
ncbi:hypothetical protein POL68_30920 [Stigmatella sp. ncwal1]|uniref:ELWxxDGT repeat-containing protein n=1 Tax=Stigmatella ashevillensis TaxID=2995309 RepID=A0ABT5DGX7_9BACT|nr:hypothetical protein [Stigmatella ashevillena]MDC0712915.1 hypothetical protein [Stigmatella ashevillena]